MRDQQPAPQSLRWVRQVLIGLTTIVIAVFGIAMWVNPYAEDGQPLRMATHRQLGLPPCTFYSLTGLPCPSCGLTTSFALFVRGDLANSWRANAVGTLLAIFLVLGIPWGIAGAVRGRPLWIDVEKLISRAMLTFIGLLLMRWIIVMALTI
jgi:hypothetical protein